MLLAVASVLLLLLGAGEGAVSDGCGTVWDSSTLPEELEPYCT